MLPPSLFVVGLPASRRGGTDASPGPIEASVPASGRTAIPASEGGQPAEAGVPCTHKHASPALATPSRSQSPRSYGTGNVGSGAGAVWQLAHSGELVPQ